MTEETAPVSEGFHVAVGEVAGEAALVFTDVLTTECLLCCQFCNTAEGECYTPQLRASPKWWQV